MPSSTSRRCQALLAVVAALCLWMVPTEWVGFDDELAEPGWHGGSDAQDDEALAVLPTQQAQPRAQLAAALPAATPRTSPTSLEIEPTSTAAAVVVESASPARERWARAPPA